MRDVRDTFTKAQAREFSQLLLGARKRRGMNQSQVAEQIGVSQTLISSLERGPSMGMRAGELFKVLAFYGIEANLVSDILGYTEYTAHREDDPRVTRLYDVLNAVPDSVLDDILGALELMARGALSA